MRRTTQFLALCTIAVRAAPRLRSRLRRRPGDRLPSRPRRLPWLRLLPPASLRPMWPVTTTFGSRRIGSDSALLTMVFNATGDQSTSDLQLPRQKDPSQFGQDGRRQHHDHCRTLLECVAEGG